MGTIIRWALIAVVVAVAVAGVTTAASLGRAISRTGGASAGIVVGNIPTLVSGFQDGVTAAEGNGKKGNGTASSSWTGGTLNNWTGQQTAPAAQRARPKPVKPNA